MAKHEFGIMENNPISGERYDRYEPEKYNCIPVDDDYIEGIVSQLDDIDFFWHSLDIPRKGLAYCGITLIPPASCKSFVSVIENIEELSELKILLNKAYITNKYIIHYGL